MTNPANVDFFLKDELEWEVRARGQVPKGTVVLLRKQLHEAIASGLVPDRPVTIADITPEFDLCLERVGELQDLVIELQPVASTSPARIRVKQRLKHLNLRLQNLLLNKVTEAMGTEISELILQTKTALNNLEHTQVLCVDPNQGPSNLMPAPEIAGNQDINHALQTTSATYQQLPNPLAHIIRRLPVVDGLDTDKLLDFLKILFQLADFPGISVSALLELIYPYCRGLMAERVVAALKKKANIDAFHREVLDGFVSGGVA